jgi:two-component system C4-dicarboxylate transport sensor histidine kinase DctB
MAVWASELIIRAASYLGGLPMRFGVVGCLIAFLVFREPLQLVRPFEVQPWPIPYDQVMSEPWLHSHFNISLDIALLGVLAAALVHRLARDLGAARSQFRAIATGELPRSTMIAGREESGRLLERLAHLSSQLSKRPFLEQLSVDIRGRADQLRIATRELSETNRQRVDAERFAAIAGIVATASHELRNPVAQIAGNLPLIHAYVESTSRNLRAPGRLGRDGAHRLARTAQQLSASGRDVEESARRASLVLGDLNTISATPLRGLEEVELRTVVERTIRLTPRDSRIQMQCELEAVPALTARAGEIEQVVANLIENALDAVVPGGTVTVRLQPSGKDILLEIEDDGCGMTQEVLAHATEPFFTTKPPGKGSGLGLAIASSIIRAHEGTLSLQTREGAGTRVEVRLPLPERARE